MRTHLLLDSLAKRVLVVDGAMGTALQHLGLQPDAFGRPEREGCNEALILSRPDILRGVHEGYLKAGCDIIETNTFGATPLVLSEYGLEKEALEINRRAAALARELALGYSTAAKPRFVAGSIGPTTKALSLQSTLEFDTLVEHFRVQAQGLWEGGVDYFLLETCQDTRNVKAAVLALQQLFKERSAALPIAISCTIERSGRMLAGQAADAFLASVAHLDLLYIGLNCATGPVFMADSLRELARLSPFRIACVPNAGLPDEHGHYGETPESLCDSIGTYLQQGWLNLVGGCCGTHDGHIKALSALAARSTPRALPQRPTRLPGSFLSGIELVEIIDEARPVLVGERMNVIGSREFRELVAAEQFDEASGLGLSQARAGAAILDVCVGNPLRNELKDMRSLLLPLLQKVKAPLMIDSSEPQVVEAALKASQGKAIINSINLEAGEERFDLIVPLARRYGAALVVGTIDDTPEQGMALTRGRKLAVAERSHQLLVEKYDFPPEDIYFDPLVFPCATGDPQYVGSAKETIEGLRLIKERFPLCKSVLGISNVSFGLPPAGREVLNSVFLYHCVQAGLDLAIVNPEKLVRFASIPKDQLALAEAVLFKNDGDSIAAFAAAFRNAALKAADTGARPPLLERLARAVIEGSKQGLIDDLNEALKTLKPLEIINGPLMKGMDEVGRLFNANQLIVAEVLQSAEVMKAAVAHLKRFLEKSETTSRGKILLATVKGDVHDIGKNLVEIILANNGFTVVNLGIRVPPEQLIQAVSTHQPDLIGLSGLLVKSAHQMVATLEDFARAEVRVPVLVGGAALNGKFVDRAMAPAYRTGDVFYAQDAMDALSLAKRIVDPHGLEALRKETQLRRAAGQSPPLPRAEEAGAPASRRTRKVAPLAQLPTAPDFERHILLNTPLNRIHAYINPLLLYGRHLGIPGATVRELGKAQTTADWQTLREKEPKAVQVWEAVENVKARYGASVLVPSAVYRFFRAVPQGNSIRLHSGGDASAAVIGTFNFPRQPASAGGEPGLCLSDYLAPEGDTLAAFVVSIGHGVREVAERLKQDGEYLQSHILQALALESAEAYAEWLHGELRALWGFPDPASMTLMERFQAKYRGKRYSFGYPACPNLDDQKLLFELLGPEDIGVALTDGMMMDPESSVSAIVFHHPEAIYFSVGDRHA